MVSGSCFEVDAVQAIHSVSKIEAIRELIDKAPKLSNLEDRKNLEDSTIDRENMLSTACGHGVAFTHGKTNSLKKVTIGFGVSRKGISFGSPDGSLVYLIFLFASPPDKSREYLQALSTLARVIYVDCAKENMLTAFSIQEIEEKISGLVKSRIGNPAAFKS